MAASKPAAERLLLVDGHSLLFRAYHALPPLSRPDGTPTGAVYGFANMLLKALADFRPERVAVALDASTPTFRHEQFADYKAHREKAPDEFRVQVPLARRLLELLEIPCVTVDGWEADDIIGTLAVAFAGQGWTVLVLTGDRDLLQLVRPGIEVVLTRRGLSDLERLDAEGVRAKLGIEPEYVPDLKGLMGDPSDNIPGVAGIGEKSAVTLVQRYGRLENLFAQLDAIPESRWRKALTGQQAIALASRDLATIRLDAPLPPIPWPKEPYRVPRTPALFQFLREMAFDSLARRLAAPGPDPAPAAEVPAPSTGPVATVRRLDTWPEAPVVGIEPHADGWLLAWAPDDAGVWAGPLEPRPDQELVGFGIKGWILRTAPEAGQHLRDAEVAAYLLDPGRTVYRLADVAAALGAPSAQPDALTLALVWPRVRERLQSHSLWNLFIQVEMPLVRILAKMEAHGVVVDLATLDGIGEELMQGIRQLEQEIWTLAGVSFNINSPQQLGEVLFDKLGLPAGRRTKTGYSTDAETLEALAPLHPLVQRVLTYRQLTKLHGTYVEGLRPLVDGSGRVHTHFNQTVTATGRLSSSDPNLQNIPVRLPLGRRIRRAFRPSPGNILLAADYSQIELRLLAHLAQDPVLTDAFRRGEDIHRRTAAEMFGVPPEAVTEELRGRAKAVNFGIIYGISDFGLANNTGVSRQEAAEYIRRYFERYPRIKDFLDGAVEQAREKGYVETILGRRRYLPDIHSKNRVRRQYAERMAMNTVIQGSAADLIKTAMVRLDRAMSTAGMRSALVLQVHDELIWDTVPDEEAELARMAAELMSSALELSVPLVVDLKRGPNWEAMEAMDPGEGGATVAGAS
ncbi:MAG: DNA polymerase I [Actinomycetia bacterium]|nr:DNA polymerase I [Actinomycetes bacterium]